MMGSWAGVHGREPLGYPATYRVITSGQIPCVVSMQTLHALARAPDAGGWPRASVIDGHGRVPLNCVTSVSGFQLTG